MLWKAAEENKIQQQLIEEQKMWQTKFMTKMVIWRKGIFFSNHYCLSALLDEAASIYFTSETKVRQYISPTGFGWIYRIPMDTWKIRKALEYMRSIAAQKHLSREKSYIHPQVRLSWSQCPKKMWRNASVHLNLKRKVFIWS